MAVYEEEFIEVKYAIVFIYYAEVDGRIVEWAYMNISMGYKIKPIFKDKVVNEIRFVVEIEHVCIKIAEDSLFIGYFMLSRMYKAVPSELQPSLSLRIKVYPGI